MLEPFKTLTSKPLVLPQANIDTDQITPGRFLSVTTRDGLAEACFANARAAEPDHPMNAPGARERRILVAGENFGCGSSREHAVWALYDFGVRAVLSVKLADIFRSNALKNGLLAVQVDADLHARLLKAEDAEVVVDLEAQTVTVGGARCAFAIDPFARRCLMEGVDQLDFLLGQRAAIEGFEAARTRAA